MINLPLKNIQCNNSDVNLNFETITFNAFDFKTLHLYNYCVSRCRKQNGRTRDFSQ